MNMTDKHRIPSIAAALEEVAKVFMDRGIRLDEGVAILLSLAAAAAKAVGMNRDQFSTTATKIYSEASRNPPTPNTKDN